MTRIATTPAPKHSVVEDALWRALDDQGWELLDAQKFEDARCYFEAANDRLGPMAPTDYRRGRTLAGLAWTTYRLTQQADNAELSQDAADAEFRSAQVNAERAVTLLSGSNLDPGERQFLARAQHILGLILIELCQGDAANAALQSAALRYSDIGAGEELYEVLHLRGKLQQCRRQFVEAARLFRRIKDEAADHETRLRAVVDLANTLAWLGQIREAWTLQAEWRQLDGELQKQPETKRPADLLFRGRLLFARVNVLYGDFAVAENLLDAALAQLCHCDGISPVCRSVYWIVAAELALERGQLTCVLEHLSRAALSEDEANLSGRCYSCLDIVAIDAACRRCVIECCTHECFTRRCFLRRRACRITFTTTTVTMQPVKFSEILTAVVTGLRGRARFNAGSFKAAAADLHESRARIESLVHPHSPLLFPLLVSQAELAQTRLRPEAEIDALLRHFSAAADALQAAPYQLAVLRHEVLAATCVHSSHYEAAAALYLGALSHSRQFRAARHPVHAYLAIQAAWARGIARLGPDDNAEEHEKSHQAIQEALRALRAELENLSLMLGCEDYRLLFSRTLLAWLWFAACAGLRAEQEFEFLKRSWGERDERTTAQPKDVASKTPGTNRDPRQGLAMLGAIAVQSELGATPPPDPFAEYLALSRTHGEIADLQIAVELERLSDVLFVAELPRAAELFSKRAKDLLNGQPPDKKAGQLPPQPGAPPRAPTHPFPLLRRLRRK